MVADIAVPVSINTFANLALQQQTRARANAAHLAHSASKHIISAVQLCDLARRHSPRVRCHRSGWKGSSLVPVLVGANCSADFRIGRRNPPFLVVGQPTHRLLRSAKTESA